MDEAIARLLTLAAELWAQEHPDQAMRLRQSGYATSDNRFLWLAEEASQRVVKAFQ